MTDPSFRSPRNAEPGPQKQALEEQVAAVNNRSMMARRSFLRSVGLPVALLGAGASLSPLLVREVRATGTKDERVAAADTHRWGLLIDTEKCATGCDACVRGCNEEHGITSTGNDTTDAQWIRKLELQDRISGRETSLPMMCQHCDSAPCVDVCPTGASFKRADGVVLVNKHTCIGCRYCMMACPYKARSFIHEELTEQKSLAPRGKGTVESCTLCVHRIDRNTAEGQTHSQTACAEACTAEGHNAILFGDLNDPQSELSQKISARGAVEVRSDLRLNTGVRYINP